MQIHTTFQVPQNLTGLLQWASEGQVIGLELVYRNVSPYFDTHISMEGVDATRGSLQKDLSNCKALVWATF